MRYRQSISNRLYALFALLGLSLILVWPSLVKALPLTASHRLQNAWTLANSVGIYEYRTDLIQTTHPTERLENVGRGSKSTRMVVTGQTNRHDNFVQMMISGQTGAAGVIEIKVEDEQAFGRLNRNDEWTEIDATAESDLFAPGGDPLGFLVAAENVREEGDVSTQAFNDKLDGLDRLISNPQLLAAEGLTRYTFSLNGVKYAEFMRSQMEEDLRRKGELPGGMTLGLAQQYVQMKAQGEIWVNDAGLPVRQIMHLEFPAEKGAVNWVSAEITTDFTDWGAGAMGRWTSPPKLGGIEGGLAMGRHALSTAFTFANLQQMGRKLGLLLLVSGLLLFMIRHRDSQKLYAAFSMAVILSMVFGPLMKVQQVHAFSQGQLAKEVEQQAESEQQEELSALHADLSGQNFEPHVKPGTEGRGGEGASRGNPLRLPFGRGGERVIASSLADAEVDSCDPESDTDGDGLSDNVECYEIGTWRDDIDTDNDFISDKAEVTGFQDSRGVWWYLDPRNPDSNGDGLADSIECAELADMKVDGSLEVGFSYSACADSDGDDVPDLFDYDNDGDGVPDSVDTSPFDYIGDLSSGLADGQLNFDLVLSETDHSVFVDFEVRPTEADHLWRKNQVLDWFDNDTEGQVMRKAGQSTADTWLDYDPNSYGGSATADHGDLRLNPMLEIEISYHADNPSAGLPLTGTVSNSPDDIPDYSTIDWLDHETLDEYGISVNYDEAAGETLTLYVPLNTLKDEVGDAPVSFTGRMIYEPTSSHWGSPHQVRLLWMVNALTDACDTSVMPDQFISQKGMVRHWGRWMGFSPLAFI